MKHLLPTEHSTKKFLSALFGDALKVSLSESAGNNSYAAVYVDADDIPGAVALCDPAFAAFSSAALSMIPKGAAEDAVKSGDLPKNLLDNLYEVMNICTRLVIDESTPHLRLVKLCPVNETDTTEIIKDAATEAGFNVEIPGYGTGSLTFLVI